MKPFGVGHSATMNELLKFYSCLIATGEMWESLAEVDKSKTHQVSIRFINVHMCLKQCIMMITKVGVNFSVCNNSLQNDPRKVTHIYKGLKYNMENRNGQFCTCVFKE